MSLTTGLASQIGWGAEGTPGVPVAITRVFEYNSESIKFERPKIFSKAMRAGRKTDDRYALGNRQGGGDIEYEVMPNGFAGVLPYWLGGDVATTTPGGGSISRLHTAKVGALDGKSRTIQVGRPNSAGTVDPFTYAGCKVTDWELSMEAGSDGLLMAKETIDCVDEDTETSLAAVSYPVSNVLFPWSEANISILVDGDEYDIKKLTLGGGNSLKTDRFRIGRPTKLEQMEGSGLRQYPITMDLESWQGLVGAYGKWVDGEEFPIVASFMGPVIEGSLRYMVRVSLARCVFNGENPTVNGPDMLEQSVPGQALYDDGADTEVKIEVQNTDTTA